MVGRKQNTIEQFLSPNINIFSFLGKLYNVPGIQNFRSNDIWSNTNGKKIIKYSVSLKFSKKFALSDSTDSTM